jgi:hypothetical protein
MSPDLLAAAIEWREHQRPLDAPYDDTASAWVLRDQQATAARARLITAIDAYTAETQAAVDLLTGGAS